MKNHFSKCILGFLACMAACDDSPSAARQAPAAQALKRQAPVQEAAAQEDYKPQCTVDLSRTDQWITFADPEVRQMYVDTMKWAERASTQRGPFEEIQKQIESMARKKNVMPEQMAVDLYFAANAGAAAYPNPITPLMDSHGDTVVPWLVRRITLAASRDERVFLFKRLLNQTGREKTQEVITSKLSDPSLLPQQMQAWEDLQRHLNSLPR